MPKTPAPVYVHANSSVELRMTRLGARITLEAIQEQIEEPTDLDAVSIERLKLIAWAIRCQLDEQREVTA